LGGIEFRRRGDVLRGRTLGSRGAPGLGFANCSLLNRPEVNGLHAVGALGGHIHRMPKKPKTIGPAGPPLVGPRIHDFLDYRRFLREALAFEKAQGRIHGHRDVATYLGLKSPGHITWILQGKRNLVGVPLERMPRVVGISGQDAEYFALLVVHNDTSNPEERRAVMAKIAAHQSRRKVKPAQSAARYWTHSRHAVIREMVAITPYRRSDAALIARKLEPPSTEQEAVQSLDLLLDLEMIREGEDGTLVRSDSILSAGENWTVESVRELQRQILTLSARALEVVPREEREISTVTFSVSRERFQKIRTRIQEMRAEILALVRTDPEPDAVYHLAIQLFPATTRDDA